MNDILLLKLEDQRKLLSNVKTLFDRYKYRR